MWCEYCFIRVYIACSGICHYVCYIHSTDEITKLLLEEAKMDPNAKNNNGDTPLNTACRNERSEQVKLLVRDGRCKLNEKDGSRNTPQLLHLAVKHEDKELVKLLVRDEICNPHEKDSRGDTALHVACRLSNGGELFTICCHVLVVYMNKCVV